LNGNDKTFFQKVTTLDYIDNSGIEPMYYFKNGYKCAKSYIAPVNSLFVEGFEFAEISSPENKWSLMVVKRRDDGDKPKPQKADNGIIYDAPPLPDANGNISSEPRIEVISKPTPVSNYIAPDDSMYEYVFEDSESFDFNENQEVKSVSTTQEAIPVYSEPVQTEVQEPVHQDPRKVVQMNSPVKVINNFFKVEGDTLVLDARSLMSTFKTVSIRFDAEGYEMPMDEFIDNGITPKEEKIVEKVVEKEVIVKKDATDIEINLTDEQKGLIDNMIDMSNKMECTIDMELTLRLPPVQVYKLIKTVYPAGMDKGFVSIIANRMQVNELKTAVADGLMAFYDEELTPEETKTPVAEPIVEEPKTKKPGRTKK